MKNRTHRTERYRLRQRPHEILNCGFEKSAHKRIHQSSRDGTCILRRLQYSARIWREEVLNEMKYEWITEIFSGWSYQNPVRANEISDQLEGYKCSLARNLSLTRILLISNEIPGIPFILLTTEIQLTETSLSRICRQRKISRASLIEHETVPLSCS